MDKLINVIVLFQRSIYLNYFRYKEDHHRESHRSSRGEDRRQNRRSRSRSIDDRDFVNSSSSFEQSIDRIRETKSMHKGRHQEKSLVSHKKGNSAVEPQNSGRFVKKEQSYGFDKDRHVREQKNWHSETNQNLKDKVFVGGLDYNLSDQDLKYHFEQYGLVKESQIIRDPITKSSRGFGFVRFFDESIAGDLIINKQVTMINGRRVDMRTADLKTPDKIASINRHAQKETKNLVNQNNSVVPRGGYSPKQNSIISTELSKSYMIPSPSINPNQDSVFRFSGDGISKGHNE